MSCNLRQPRLLFATLAALLLSATGALAQNPPTWVGSGPGTIAPADVKEAKVVEHLNTALPLDLAFVDDDGHPVQLKKYFNGTKPVILQLGYYNCPMLCGLVAQGMVDSLKTLTLVPGKDFEFVYVSIDPTETPELAKQKKAAYLSAYGRNDAAAAFHMLTGKGDAIAQLAEATGFVYRWIPSAGQYAHPAVIMLAMPEGKISRYLYGVHFDPQTLRLSLVEASNGKIGTTTDAFLLTCFQYDGAQGKYAMTALTIMRTGGVLMILIVGTCLTVMFRRESKLEAK